MVSWAHYGLVEKMMLWRGDGLEVGGVGVASLITLKRRSGRKRTLHPDTTALSTGFPGALVVNT